MDDPYRTADHLSSISPEQLQQHSGDEVLPLRLVLQGSELAISLTRPEMTIGRHTENDIRLPLPDVSRRHCRFLHTDGRWQVVDLNSLNGVYLNGEKVQQATVFHNDVIRIGSFTFDVEIGNQDRRSREADHPIHVLQSISEALPPIDDKHLPQRRQAS
jgi:pSer/pThr/pTyr-binding forkhead associated (FHA) protein